jgi:magnesium-transporting ATPase (P-type)
MTRRLLYACCSSHAALRFKCDSEWNKRRVSRLGKGGEFEQVESRTLRVGQVIKIDCDSEIPADVVLLQVWFCF